MNGDVCSVGLDWWLMQEKRVRCNTFIILNVYCLIIEYMVSIKRISGWEFSMRNVAMIWKQVRVQYQKIECVIW